MITDLSDCFKSRGFACSEIVEVLQRSLEICRAMGMKRIGSVYLALQKVRTSGRSPFSMHLGAGDWVVGRLARTCIVTGGFLTPAVKLPTLGHSCCDKDAIFALDGMMGYV
jgi:hypothetical protein